MKTYHNALRPEPHYRKEAFDAGLQALGYTPSDPGKCDLYLTWNRFGTRETIANAVEARGGQVLVAENATWGNDFLGGRWYSIWPRFHNRRDTIRAGSNSRWDDLGIELESWRPAGGEIVGLMQRGIGPRGTPANWTPPGCTRIRKHPGNRPCVPLDVDLAKASEVRTWGSGAAVKALMWGIRVKSHMPLWAAEQQNTDESRLDMMRRLAWAQFQVDEIQSGEAFHWLLSSPA